MQPLLVTITPASHAKLEGHELTFTNPLPTPQKIYLYGIEDITADIDSTHLVYLSLTINGKHYSNIHPLITKEVVPSPLGYPLLTRYCDNKQGILVYYNQHSQSMNSLAITLKGYTGEKLQQLSAKLLFYYE